ncbi:MAG: hypothetical protein WCG55_01020 [bacterium]
MSIYDFKTNIKGWVGERQEKLLYIGILALSAGISFYLGYVARAETHKEPLVAIECPLNAYISPISSDISSSHVSTQNAQSGAFIASKNGKKYYPASCAGASKIKATNRVYFQTSKEAESAGYSLASQCS